MPELAATIAEQADRGRDCTLDEQLSLYRSTETADNIAGKQYAFVACTAEALTDTALWYSDNIEYDVEYDDAGMQNVAVYASELAATGCIHITSRYAQGPTAGV